MAKRKVGVSKVKKSSEVTNILTYLIDKNGYFGEDDLLDAVFTGETKSVKPTTIGISVWGYIHKSAIIHKTSKFGSSRVTDCYLKNMEAFIHEPE